VSANPDVVKAAVKGIEEAFYFANRVKRGIPHRPFINVSLGLKGDPHVRNAHINVELCTECGECREACEQEAINDSFQVIKQRCIGCGQCAEKCSYEAIEFYTRKVDFKDVLPKCLTAGAENLELHAVIVNDDEVMKDWQTIVSHVPNNFVSMCLDRSKLSNDHLIHRIKRAKELAGERLIIQADGVPMSGGKDDYNTTLQAIAIADIVKKSGMQVMVLASGGTNSKTGEMAKFCHVKINGVSIGTFARKLVRNELSNPGFDSDLKILQRAVHVAKNLVDANISQISR
jgi:Fe-S-cluster-containing hydrogenase component 2